MSSDSPSKITAIPDVRPRRRNNPFFRASPFFLRPSVPFPTTAAADDAAASEVRFEKRFAEGEDSKLNYQTEENGCADRRGRSLRLEDGVQFLCYPPSA